MAFPTGGPRGNRERRLRYENLMEEWFSSDQSLYIRGLRGSSTFRIGLGDIFHEI